MRSLQCREGKSLAQGDPLSAGMGTHIYLSGPYHLTPPLAALSTNSRAEGPSERGETGREETLHQFHFPLGTEQPCWLLITNVPNVKLWWIVCQFSYLYWHKGGLVGEFRGVRALLFIHRTSHNCSHRDAGRVAHINSHKLPSQNVKIKSGFLFWEYAWRMLTPSDG